MTEFQKWKETSAQYDMDSHEEEIARDGYHGGENSMRRRVLEAIESCLVRDPTLQSLYHAVEEL